MNSSTTAEDLHIAASLARVAARADDALFTVELKRHLHDELAWSEADLVHFDELVSRWRLPPRFENGSALDHPRGDQARGEHRDG